MDIRQRAELFSQYVGLELKGKITSRGYTAKSVAEQAQRSAAAFNRWLNGHVALPLTVLFEACEIIGVEPKIIVDAAYDRIVVEFGEAIDDVESRPIAAKRGLRKAEFRPAE